MAEHPDVTGELTNGTYRQALIFTILDGTIVDLQNASDDTAIDDACYR